MGLGKSVRLRRLFSHPSGRFCSVAVDHFLNYAEGLPRPLRQMRPTLASLVAGRPDAVTMNKGVALATWEPYAGAVPLIVQTVAARPDDNACEFMSTVEEAVVLGADAVAGAAFIRGRSEAAHLRMLADLVREAAMYDMPVVTHIYPRVVAAESIVEAGFAEGAAISHTPEDVAWAVHCALEIGADIIKVPYVGDVAAFRDIVNDCPRPIVVAGGPQTPTLAEALALTGEAMAAGARGATIGRNVWGCPRVTATLRAFKAVIHEGAAPAEALSAAGL